VRADFVRDLRSLRLLRARSRPILLTCRSDAEGGRSTDAASRRRLLAEAVTLGFDLVDVEARSGFEEVIDAKRVGGSYSPGTTSTARRTTSRRSTSG